MTNLTKIRCEKFRESFYHPDSDEIIPNTIEFCYILYNFDGIFIATDMKQFKIDRPWYVPTKI
jgi:hypothetical protein